MNRAENEMASQCKEARDNQMKQYGDSLDPSKITESLKSAANLDSIKNLGEDTKSKFETALSLVQKGGFAQKAGGFLGSVF